MKPRTKTPKSLGSVGRSAATLSAAAGHPRLRRLAIVGLGYVGLPSAVSFAEAGYDVIGADVKEQAIARIKKGDTHLPDLGLDARVRALVQDGRLTATTDVAQATRDADAVFIMVPTPLTADKQPDLRFIVSAGRSVSQGLRKGHLVVLESTVYPGVTEDVLRPELERSGLTAGTDFGLAYCPERYNPGDSDHTIERTKRIVGGIDEASAKDAALLYASITKGGVVPVKDIRTCEAAKVIENTQRDLNIALMNEFALILERLGLDVNEVLEAAATKWNFLPFRPGPGVGGHCLPKDPYYLVRTAEKAGYKPRIITAGREINDGMPSHVAGLALRALKLARKEPRKSRIAILGLSYKEEIGDTRHAPAFFVAERLHAAGVEIVSVDPFVDAAEAKSSYHSRSHTKTLGDLEGGVDAWIHIVPHRAYTPLDLAQLRKKSRSQPIFVDGCRRTDPREVSAAGFSYVGVGAGRHNPPG